MHSDAPLYLIGTRFLAHSMRRNSTKGVSEDPRCRNSNRGVFEVPVHSDTPPCLIGNEVSDAPGVQKFH